MRYATDRTGLRFSLRTRPGRRWAFAGMAALVLAFWPSPVEADVHPFYSTALEAGTAAYDRGDFARAAERLRIACFGMLDEPSLLAEALTRLGLAQAAAGQRDDFVATFGRISEIEERFNAYSSSRLPAAMRTRFEEHVGLLVPASTLEQSTAFAQLHRQQESQRLENMLPVARTKALEQIVATHPGDLGWQLMLATAHIESGSGADAVASLEGMAAEQPDQQRVACLLGRAYLQSGRCEAVLEAPLESVHRCDVRRLPTAELVHYLECLSGAERWLEATSVLASLPEERLAGRPFPSWEKRVARRIEQGVEVEMLPPYVAVEVSAAAAQSEAAPLPISPAAGQPTATAAAPPITPPRSRLPPAELARLRQQLDRARSVTDLQDVAGAAEELNREYPEAGSEPLAIAGEAAYRASKWQLAADYLRASGGPPDDRYDLLFYLSVSLYELGDLEGAKLLLLRAMPGLEQTPLVERYRRKILGPKQ